MNEGNSQENFSQPMDLGNNGSNCLSTGTQIIVEMEICTAAQTCNPEFYLPIMDTNKVTAHCIENLDGSLALGVDIRPDTKPVADFGLVLELLVPGILINYNIPCVNCGCCNYECQPDSTRPWNDMVCGDCGEIYELKGSMCKECPDSFNNLRGGSYSEFQQLKQKPTLVVIGYMYNRNPLAPLNGEVGLLFIHTIAIIKSNCYKVQPDQESTKSLITQTGVPVHLATQLNIPIQVDPCKMQVEKSETLKQDRSYGGGGR